MLSRFMPRDFLKSTFVIALPIALQSFVTSMVNLIDVMMIGRLGDANIAAAGVANQVYFILNIVLLGICSGASVFMSQFWGKKDMPNLHRSIGLMYMLALLFSLIFTAAATVFSPGRSSTSSNARSADGS